MVLDVKSITQNKGLKAGKMKGKTNIINNNGSVGGFSNSNAVTVFNCLSDSIMETFISSQFSNLLVFTFLFVILLFLVLLLL